MKSLYDVNPHSISNDVMTCVNSHSISNDVMTYVNHSEGVEEHDYSICFSLFTNLFTDKMFIGNSFAYKRGRGLRLRGGHFVFRIDPGCNTLDDLLTLFGNLHISEDCACVAAMLFRIDPGCNTFSSREKTTRVAHPHPRKVLL